MKQALLILGILMLAGCEEDLNPKPKAFLALNYPEANYIRISSEDCPYSFEKNTLAKIKPSRNRVPCWVNLDYENMMGQIYITYQPIRENLDSLLIDAQKLPLKHTVKADAIEGDLYANEVNRTYGMFYEVKGDAASQAQFYLTDSTKHFITGSIYFDRLPNFDSLMPAAAYLQKDIKHMMETMKWDN